MLTQVLNTPANHKVVVATASSDPRFNIDVLKVEVPNNVKYVEGFGDGEIVHTRKKQNSFSSKQDFQPN